MTRLGKWIRGIRRLRPDDLLTDDSRLYKLGGGWGNRVAWWGGNEDRATVYGFKPWHDRPRVGDRVFVDGKIFVIAYIEYKRDPSDMFFARVFRLGTVWEGRDWDGLYPAELVTDSTEGCVMDTSQARKLGNVWISYKPYVAFFAIGFACVWLGVVWHPPILTAGLICFGGTIALGAIYNALSLRSWRRYMDRTYPGWRERSGE